MLMMMVIVEDSYVDDDIVFDDYGGDIVDADNDGYS